eukprot:3725643-Prymnesium_polylepis.1
MTWDLSGHNYGVQLVLKRSARRSQRISSSTRRATRVRLTTRLAWCASSHATASCRARKCEIAPRGCAYRISPLAFHPMPALHAPPAPR